MTPEEAHEHVLRKNMKEARDRLKSALLPFEVGWVTNLTGPTKRSVRRYCSSIIALATEIDRVTRSGKG